MAVATKGQRVGFRRSSVEHRAINGHEPIANKERTRHARRLGDHLTALTHQCLEALASQCLATSAQSRITNRTLGLSRMDIAELAHQPLPPLPLVPTPPHPPQHPNHPPRQAPPPPP